MSKKKKTCPVCFKKTAWKEISGKENIEVRGERFEVKVRYYKCPACGEEFERLTDPIDPLDQAYRLYRKKHNMMQPGEIRALRKKYNLTQKELARILGWGDVTLSRYENGALQDESHDNLLHLCKNPDNLFILIQKNAGITG